ncbi:hypothetical protein BH11PSE12_BH11PSE12_08200 [soil metagenome]
MPNLYQQFKALLPEVPLLVGTVTSIQTGGCVITLPDGKTILARGSAVIGSNVFVKDGAIQGLAPNLTVQQIDI